ncbi:2-phosphosulfolactate phosphatase [candidate division KSB1 bacterium]|nr:2-phosphosulfolactate phosphatase [candidate division KSB1 bacterium]
MNVNVLHLIEGARKARGITVIIDVFRAFSTACYIFQNGARTIIPIGDIQLAYQLKHDNPDYVLVGERGGIIQPGFDYGNSPTLIRNVDFSEKTIVQTTSAGTQGIVNAIDADEIITGSFVNADAIVSYLRWKHPPSVSLVAMGHAGQEMTAEDLACAEYLRDRLLGEQTDFPSIVENLRQAESARKFFDPNMDWAPEEDFNLCMNLNAFHYVLRAESYRDGLLCFRKILPDENL